ncbi:MAG: hypothetical protein A2Y17_12710 [Clostridiales bacterium GWF2_38_85]|nr:MAG: hypothetical protein A2Y17_12710 [Clostridiales bacterium GWF2_38_85]HBL84120.1 AMP-dependent synthetase [Clostridiales bacterium]
MYRNRNSNYPLYEVTEVKNLREMIELNAVRFAGNTAVSYKKDGNVVDVTFSEMKEQVDAFGTALCRLGLGDKHIAIIGENCFGWFYTYLTLLNTKGVVVPIDKELPNNETINILKAAECTAVVFTQSYEKKILEMKDSVHEITHFICLDAPKTKADNFYNAEYLIETGRQFIEEGDTCYISIEPEVEELKQLMFTSGTTGVPKGVMHCQRNLVAVINEAQKYLGITKCALAVLPYHHSYEATCGILTMYHHGMRVCINETLRTFLPNLALYKPTELMLVPLFVENIYRRIWAQAEEKGKAKILRKLIKFSNAMLKIGIDLREKLFGSVREAFGGELLVAICGGAPLKPEQYKFFYSIGITLLNGYGITECSPIVAVNRNEYHREGAVGLPIPCNRVKIKNPNEYGEGEILVNGDNVMLGYYKNPTATAEVFDDGWFCTGDIGKIDKDGFLYVTGRIKNMIVLKSGKNVYPEEIEEALSNIKYIGEVIVSASKDESDIEIALCAEIFPNADMTKEMGKEAIEAEIRKEISAFNEKQPNYKLIKKIIFRDEEFEKTTSKKIKRKYQ